MSYNLADHKDHLGILLKIQRLKGELLIGRDSIKGPKGKRFPSDEMVSYPYIFHDLIRGFYKPKEMKYVLSYQNTGKYTDATSGRIFWTNEKEGEFEYIEMLPPSGKNDNRKKSDIEAARNCLIDKVPIGIFEKIEKGKNKCLGLGIIAEERENGLFIVKPYSVADDLEQNPSISSSKINDAMNDPNYFIFHTKETNKNYFKESEFVVNGINWYEDIIKVGDIIFFAQLGKSDIYEKGFHGVAIVNSGPFDSGYTKPKKGNPYYKIEIKPVIRFPEVLKREDFSGYHNLIDLPFIGLSTSNEAFQVAHHIKSIEKSKHLVGALINIFPNLKNEFDKIFGIDFSINPGPANYLKGLNLINSINNTIVDLKNVKPNIIKDEPSNLIIYGAPGTGKSFSLKEKVNKLFPEMELKRRITFHPNYSYRNFMGSYKPKPIYKETDRNIFKADRITDHDHQKEPIIEYVFEPGPFLEMFVNAYHYPNHNFVIIIEEINRANTAAVFGDIFQLLDRDVSGKSEYPITLEKSAHDFLKASRIHDEEIAIPSNLYLWGTMNNADQGVMPMDSAFKRRWSFEHLRLNEFEEKVKDIEINFPWGEKVKWNKFRETINNKLRELKIHEDKFIGPFFLSESEIKEEKAILNKLLLYLKDDVLRYKPGIFSENLRTFSDISEKFLELTDNPSANVFSESISFE